MVIKIAICEDESYFLTKLHSLVYKYLKNKKVETSIQVFSDGATFLASNQDYDIVLMDIELPKLDGMSAVNNLRKNKKMSQVIFITAHKDYVFQAFEVDAIDYLLKPIDDVKFFATIDRAMERIVNHDDKFLLLQTKNGFIRIHTKNIRFCEVFNHQVFIHTTKQKYQYIGTLDMLEAELDDSFFRCHRSYIVNINHVISKQFDIAYIDGGDQVLISRRKQKKFNEKVLNTFEHTI